MLTDRHLWHVVGNMGRYAQDAWLDAAARTNPLARVNPFNPCKPIYSDACHNPAPLGYYEAGEDWAGLATSGVITRTVPFGVW